MKIVYKVVTKEYKSTHSPFSVEYQPFGKKILPPIPNSYLFCFPLLKDAIKFKAWDEYILECVTDEELVTFQVLGALTYDRVKAFWIDKGVYGSMRAPLGTVGVKSLVPIRKLNYEDCIQSSN